MTLVELHGVTKRFGSAVAVDDVTARLEPGRITALLGPSGCGKTTVLRMIAGLTAPSAGAVRFDGHDIAGVPPERRSAVLVFQQTLLFPYLSVGANVAFGLRMRGVPKAEARARVADMLARVDLPGSERRRPRELSGGQAQRVALARALVVEPDVLLLDEPLASVDTHLREDLRALVRELQRERGVTTVLVTHDQEEAVAVADRVGLLLDGRLRQLDAPAELFERPRSPGVARFLGSTNLLAGEAAPGASTVATDVGELRTEAPVSGATVLSLRPEAVDLAPAPDAPNRVEAVVKEAAYLGARVRVHLAAGVVELVASASPEAAAHVVAGHPLTVALPPARLWPLPEPEEDP